MEQSALENSQEPQKPKRSFLRTFLKFILILTVTIGLGFAIIAGIRGVNKVADSSSDGPAGPARNYAYPAPTAEAQNRQVDCEKDLRIYVVHPEKSVLCLNLYQTSPTDIQTKLAGQSYSNIVLYGQNIFFDVAANVTKTADFHERIYNVAKFTDLITLPKMMALYGVNDLSFINKDFSPYPALYYSVRNQQDVNEYCNSQYNVGGCSQFHVWITVEEGAISSEDQISKVYRWSRNETDDHLFYRQTIPSDCYISHVILHETAHSMIYAREHTIVGMSMMGNTNKPPKWFNEEQAGAMEVIGPELVCQIGTDDVSGSFSKKVTDANFLKFQSVFPSNFIAGGGTKNDCQKAILTSFYRYLSQGSLWNRMPKLMAEIREKSKIKGFLDNDQAFASLMLDFLDNDPTEKEFLNSKSCGL